MFGKLLKLKTFLLLLLIPSLVALIVPMAFLIYNSLYNTVLSGFDKKLLAISSTLSSFVDGDTYSELENFQQVRGMAYNSVSQLLYGNYYIDNRILVISTRTGRKAYLPNEIGFEGIEDIAFNDRDGFIYGVIIDANVLIRIDSNTGIGESVKPIERDCYGITYHSREDVLYCSNNEEIFRISTSGEFIDSVSLSLREVRGLAYNSRDNYIYGVVTNSNEIIRIMYNQSDETKDDNSQNYTKLFDITDPNEMRYDIFIQKEVYKYGVFGLAYSPNEDKLYGSTTAPLIAINPQEGNVIPFSFNKDTNDERRELYMSYASPMIDIQNKKDVTFLITTKLQDRGKALEYILDSSQSAEMHAFVGYVDSEEIDKAIKDVWFQGIYHISGITFWKDWGMLKTSYTPIIDSDLEIAGIAGTDVEVSIINYKVNTVLLQVILIGIFAIILAVFVSLQISLFLTKPIHNLKNTALKVATGMFGLQIELKGPKDFQKLSKSFNEMSTSLESKINNLKNSNKNIQDSHYINHSIQLLNDIVPTGSIISNFHYNHFVIPNQDKDASISDCVMLDDKLLFWNSSSFQNSFESANFRNSTLKIFNRLLQIHHKPFDVFSQLYVLCSQNLNHLGFLDISNQKYFNYSINKTTHFLEVSNELKVIENNNLSNIDTSSNNLFILSNLNNIKWIEKKLQESKTSSKSYKDKNMIVNKLKNNFFANETDVKNNALEGFVLCFYRS